MYYIHVCVSVCVCVWVNVEGTVRAPRRNDEKMKELRSGRSRISRNSGGKEGSIWSKQKRRENLVETIKR